MISLQELHDMIELDSKMDRTNLEGEILRCAKLFAKYIKEHFFYKKYVIENESKLNELIVVRMNYYNGNADAQAYRDEPFDMIVKNQKQMETYLEADAKICEQRERVDTAKAARDMIGEMVESVKYRPNHLSTIIEIRKFEQGV